MHRAAPKRIAITAKRRERVHRRGLDPTRPGGVAELGIMSLEAAVAVSAGGENQAFGA